MKSRNKKLKIFKRLFIWILYLFSGFILYAKDGYLNSLLINFTRFIYPLSIFWLQIIINKKGNLLPIDESMSTSQLWYNILPVLASFLTLIFSILNALIFVSEKLIN